MLGAWAARPPASFRPFALPTFLYVATEALAESTPLPQRGESTSLPLARKQRRWGGEGGTQRNRSAESLFDRPRRRRLTARHAYARPRLVSVPRALQTGRAARSSTPTSSPPSRRPARSHAASCGFVLTCDVPLSSRVGLSVSVCVLCVPSSTPRPCRARTRTRVAVPLCP